MARSPIDVGKSSFLLGPVDMSPMLGYTIAEAGPEAGENQH